MKRTWCDRCVFVRNDLPIVECDCRIVSSIVRDREVVGRNDDDRIARCIEYATPGEEATGFDTSIDDGRHVIVDHDDVATESVRRGFAHTTITPSSDDRCTTDRLTRIIDDDTDVGSRDAGGSNFRRRGVRGVVQPRREESRAQSSEKDGEEAECQGATREGPAHGEHCPLNARQDWR